MGCKECNDKEDTLAGGLGDSLARVIKAATGIKPCAGCDKRKETLNRWFPYKKDLDT